MAIDCPPTLDDFLLQRRRIGGRRLLSAFALAILLCCDNLCNVLPFGLLDCWNDSVLCQFGVFGFFVGRVFCLLEVIVIVLITLPFPQAVVCVLSAVCCLCIVLDTLTWKIIAFLFFYCLFIYFSLNGSEKMIFFYNNIRQFSQKYKPPTKNRTHTHTRYHSFSFQRDRLYRHIINSFT